MISDNSVSKVSEENPFLGVANLIARQQQKVTKEGSALPGADRVQTAWDHKANAEALIDLQIPKG